MSSTKIHDPKPNHLYDLEMSEWVVAWKLLPGNNHIRDFGCNPCVRNYAQTMQKKKHHVNNNSENNNKNGKLNNEQGYCNNHNDDSMKSCIKLNCMRGGGIVAGVQVAISNAVSSDASGVWGEAGRSPVHFHPVYTPPSPSKMCGGLVGVRVGSSSCDCRHNWPFVTFIVGTLTAWLRFSFWYRRRRKKY